MQRNDRWNRMDSHIHTSRLTSLSSIEVSLAVNGMSSEFGTFMEIRNPQLCYIRNDVVHPPNESIRFPRHFRAIFEGVNAPIFFYERFVALNAFSIGRLLSLIMFLLLLPRLTSIYFPSAFSGRYGSAPFSFICFRWGINRVYLQIGAKIATMKMGYARNPIYLYKYAGVRVYV